MSQYFASRSNPNVETEAETYATIDLYFDATQGTQALTPYVYRNSGFTCVLANPIILDIAHRYVMTLVKYAFDANSTAYSTTFHTFGIFCDLIEYQYVNNLKAQLLLETNPVIGITPALGTSPPVSNDVVNVTWKFINPTQKYIRDISFWILDDAGQPLANPTTGTYTPFPTKIEILIKKVNSHVVAVSQL